MSERLVPETFSREVNVDVLPELREEGDFEPIVEILGPFEHQSQHKRTSKDRVYRREY